MLSKIIETPNRYFNKTNLQPQSFEKRRIADITEAECLQLAKLLFPSAEFWNIEKEGDNYLVWVTDFSALYINLQDNDIQIGTKIFEWTYEPIGFSLAYKIIQYFDSIGIKMSSK